MAADGRMGFVALAAVSQVYARALSSLEARTFTDTCAEVKTELTVKLLGIIEISVGLLGKIECLGIMM